MKDKLTNLLTVKSIVTILLTVLFIILSNKEVIDGNAVTTIYTTVIAFYFGTQFEKKGETNNDKNSGELSNKE